MFFISAIFQAASAQCAPLWVGCLIPPRRNLTIYNKRCKLPVGDDARHRPTRRVLPYLPPPKLANLFPPLIYAPYCKPQPALSVDISFFPAVYYTSVCANFLGKGGYGMSVKAQVLSALDAARGRYISGQELADQLGVSRAAIWKAVTALRADGTPIEAITNRGYALPHGQTC